MVRITSPYVKLGMKPGWDRCKQEPSSIILGRALDIEGGASSPLLPGCPVPTCPTLAITLSLHWAPGFFWVLVTSQGQLVAFCLCHWMKPVSAEPQLPCHEPGMLLPSFCFPRRGQTGLDGSGVPLCRAHQGAHCLEDRC